MDELDKLRIRLKKAGKKITAKSVIVEWIADTNVNFTDALTLTYRNKVRDTIIAEKRLGLFLNYLNERLLGYAYKKSNKKLKVLAVLEGEEGENGKNLHWHIAIERTQFVGDEKLEEVIKRCWNKANGKSVYKCKQKEYCKDKGNERWVSCRNTKTCDKKYITNDNKIELEHIHSVSGWVNYMTKELTLTNFTGISEHCYF